MEHINFNTVANDVLAFLLGGVIVISFIYLIYLITYFKRKRLTKDWLIDDKIKVTSGSSVIDHTKLHSLVGWNQNHFFVQENSFVHQCSWHEFEYNKSAEWRKNYSSCEKFMNDKKPNFPTNTYKKNDTHDMEKIMSPTFDDNVINQLSIFECERLLKQALEEENYEMAELIRIRMEQLKK